MSRKSLRVEARVRERGLWEILVRVAYECHVDPRAILGPRSTRAIIFARRLWYLELRRKTMLSLREIGQLLERDVSGVRRGAVSAALSAPTAEQPQ